MTQDEGDLKIKYPSVVDLRAIADRYIRQRIEDGEKRILDGHHDEARRKYEEAYKRSSDLNGIDHPDTIKIGNLVADCYEALGKRVCAREYRR